MWFRVAWAVHVGLLVAAGVGCLRILYAGVVEGRGDLEAARPIARSGGFLMAGATLATVASGPVVLALLPEAGKQAILGSTRAIVAVSVGQSLTVLSGFVGLLAGLTGKPRPSGHLAAVIYLIAVGALVSLAVG